MLETDSMANMTQYVEDRVNKLTRESSYCLFWAAMQDSQELNTTLEAAGHDTSEFHAAIKETLEYIVKLKAIREEAVKRFREKGFLITVVPVDKEEDKLV